MDLLSLIIENNIKTLSIIGMGKNTGKTMTLNHILQLAELKKINLALTSMGLDGEEIDKVMENKKPKIFISKGTIIANARSLILRSKLDFEILALTDIQTPLGEIIISRSKDQGYIELSGPGSKYQLEYIISKIRETFSGIILIDGALDRSSLSSPTVTEASILATGAEIANSISSITSKIKYQIELFNLQTSDDFELVDSLSNIDQESKVVIIDDSYNLKSLPLNTAINNIDKIIEEINDKTKALFINGAIVNQTMKVLMSKVNNFDELEIIVQDATYLFLDLVIYKRFLNKGGKISVLNEINILGVTVNPFSTKGSYIDPINLLKETAETITPIPCYEIVLYKKIIGEGVENIEVFRWSDRQ